jgi:uncharacterized protein
MTTTHGKGTALITGASSGIGAIYANRLAKRGHDLILVARNRQRLTSLARRLSNETGRKVETVEADLTSSADLQRVENILRPMPASRCWSTTPASALPPRSLRPTSTRWRT